MSRLDENKKILKIIADFIEYNPDQRFNQALYKLDIIKTMISSMYYEESVKTAINAQEASDKIKKAATT